MIISIVYILIILIFLFLLYLVVKSISRVIDGKNRNKSNVF